MNHRFSPQADVKRRGALLPAIAFALLVVGAASALVMNKLWIDAARLELQNAAEATALAAAGAYLDDQLLIPNVDQQKLLLQAKRKAYTVAATNLVGGRPVDLHIDGDDPDVVFGRRVLSATGEDTFLLVNSNPTVVEVRTRRDRSQGNPIVLFYPGVTKRPYADAQFLVEAAFDNRIAHFSASPGRTVPAFPLGILLSDIEDKRTDTWQSQIVNRNGLDEYRFDQATGTVRREPDGLPEMVLSSVPLKTDPLLSNVQILDFGNELKDPAIISQIKHGLDEQALKNWDNQLSTTNTMEIPGTGYVTTDLQLALESQIGQQRLCLLYDFAQAMSVPGWTQVRCRGVVAIRILKVIPESGESATIIVQPTVMTTKSAVPVKFLNEYTTDKTTTPVLYREDRDPPQPDPNPYVYKLYLSR